MSSLFLLPVVLSEDTSPRRVLPEYNLEVASRLKYFIVENVRTARRFLKKCDPGIDISALTFFELNVKTPAAAIPAMLEPLGRGEDMGLMSEAGCPAVADPGASAVAIAQEKGYKVVPLTGPSSIIMSLMASGLNGQGFAFHGYLSIDASARDNTLKSLEAESRRLGRTQIFIETPYRNQRMAETLLRVLSPSTRLCIAEAITSPNCERIRTRSIREWRSNPPHLDKIPAIFLLLAR